MSTAAYVKGLSHPTLSSKLIIPRLVDGEIKDVDVWLEDEVPGFRTSYIQGRESYNVQVNEITSKRIVGSRYSGRQIPSRELTIHYYITVDTFKEFQIAYNKLKGILYESEEIKIVFGDEPDKFYVGTVTQTEPKYLVNHHTAEGDIYVHCAKPFKYSVTEHVVKVKPTDSPYVADIDYEGTFPAYPVLKATSRSSKLGYVSFINQNAKIIQIGTPEDTTKDQSSGKESVERLVTHFYEGASFDKYTKNAGSTIAMGSNPIVIASGADVSPKDTGHGGAYPSAYGSNTTTWHGPTLHRNVDKSGNTFSIANFSVHWRLTFVGDTTGSNLGLTQINLTGINSSGTAVSIASITYVKERTGTNDCIAIIHINGKQTTNIPFTYEHTNMMTGVGTGRGSGYIERYGKKITFHIASGKIVKTYTIPEIEKYKLTGFTVSFAKWKDGTNAIATNRLEAISVWEHNVSSSDLIPNKFASGDTIEARCESAQILINNVLDDKYGALGNDWEDFKLDPGPNQIKLVYSSSVSASDRPSYSIAYRDVYI